MTPLVYEQRSSSDDVFSRPSTVCEKKHALSILCRQKKSTKMNHVMRHSMKYLHLSNYINKISVFYTLKKQKNMFPLLTWPMPISYGNRLPVKFLSRQKRKNREFRPVFSFSSPYGFGRQTASFLVAQQKSEPSGLERCAHFFPLEVLRGTGLLRFHHRERNIFTIIKNLYME